MPRRLSALFINPGSRSEVYQELASEMAAVEPPLWAGMLAGFCRERGFTGEILDAEALQLSPKEVAEQVALCDPLLAVIVAYGHQPSASTQCMTAVGSTLQAIRSAAPRTRTLIVGGHVSALPERSMREEDVDFVCQGEGPSTLAALLPLLEAGALERLGDVPGLCWRDGLVVRANAAAPNVTDLDRDLPGIAWDLLPMERYRAHNWHCFDDVGRRAPYASLYTSLGCPFKCTFCCINAPFGRSGIRYHSPDQVIAEIDRLVRDYGVRNLKLADEMFVLKKSHVEGICERIIARGYDLNIWAYARVDTVQPALLEKMRRAGFRWLALGIESGSEHVRDGADKSLSADDITGVVRQIQAAGIHVIGNYIFGLPDDNAATMRETLGLALELNCEFANFYSAMAYPGSPLYAMALREGWELPDAWQGYSQHAFETLPLPTRHISASEVLRFRDDAFHAYFSSPSYLELVERKFGAVTRAHVLEMSRHRLRRKHA